MQPRTKVTVLSNSRGGVFSFTMNLARMLTLRDCSVRILLINEPSRKNITNRQEDQTVDHIIALNGLPNFRALMNFLFFDDSDVIHINFASFAPLAAFKKLVFGTPFVLTLHGPPQPFLESLWTDKIRYTIESLMVRFAASQASATLVVSNHVREIIRARYGVESKVIYHGIDLRNYEAGDKKEAKKQLGYSEDTPIILFVGKLNRAKDPITLIRAFSDVVNARYSYLIMAGAGELSEEVADLVMELGIQENVRLLGQLPHEELIPYYNAADVFVLPSVSESFGIVLLEAMAFGLPTIVSSAGACSEIIGDAGIDFRNGDPTDLAEKIALLIQDRELSKRLGNAGLRRVREIFPLEREAEQYCKLFVKVASQK